MHYTATNQNISWFKNEADRGTLELSPNFQRNPVWDEEQSSYLIDSLLNGLPIPEIYLRSITSPNGKVIHEVVDGQQRTRAILNFVQNDLVLEGDDVSPKWRGNSWDDFDDATKKMFWSYNIVVRDLGEVSDGEVRDLFRRLNINSIVLNDQELRHARYTGVFIRTVEGLADSDWLLNRGIVNLAQIRRMQDVEFVSELIIGLMAGPQDKKKVLDMYFADYDDDFPEADEWKKMYRDTCQLLDDVLGIEGIRAWRGKSDFYTLFLCFGGIVKDKRKLPIRKKRMIRAQLNSLNSEIRQAKKRDNTQEFNKDVHRYAEAVTRASTDLARRNIRQAVLNERIDSIVCS